MRWLTLLLLALLWCAAPTPARPQDTLRAELPADPSGRLAHILRRGTLIVGVKSDYPPWGMVDPDPASDAIVGIEPDLARDIADRLGVGLKLVSVTARNRIGRVNDGTVDLVIANMGDTAVRRTQADLIQPNYFSSGVVVYGRIDLGLSGWDALRGAPVCLTQGAYFNRTLECDYGLKGQYFPGNREARLALRYGRCVGWAFDDTALAQLVLAEPDPEFGVIVPTILNAPWAMAVAQGEGDGDWGRFLSDTVGEWHATGRILQLQRKWGVGETAFVRALHDKWSRVEDGRPACAHNPETGQPPPACLVQASFSAAAPVEMPPWANALHKATGIDLRVLFDAYDRARLMRGLALTELVSTVNTLVSEGGDTSTLLNGLLVFYFVFVLGVIWLVNRLSARLHTEGAAK